MFTIIMKLPEKLIPQSLMNWLDRYTTKRINELNQDNIKLNWTNTHVQQAVKEIADQT